MASRTVQKRRTSKPPKKRAQVVPAADDWSEDNDEGYDYYGPDDKRWPWISGLTLSILGLLDAAYLTYEHYTTNTPAGCSTHGVVNCAAVTTSIYSKIAGVPIVIPGLIFFVVMVALQLPKLWHNHNRWLRMGRVGWCVVGVVTSLTLVYHEVVDLKAICEYCTGVHVISLLLFVTTALGTNATSYIEDAA